MRLVVMRSWNEEWDIFCWMNFWHLQILFVWYASGQVGWMRVVKSGLKVALISGQAIGPRWRRCHRFVMIMSGHVMSVSLWSQRSVGHQHLKFSPYFYNHKITNHINLNNKTAMTTNCNDPRPRGQEECQGSWCPIVLLGRHPGALT
jgi:hypothetical protein